MWRKWGQRVQLVLSGFTPYPTMKYHYRNHCFTKEMKTRHACVHCWTVCVRMWNKALKVADRLDRREQRYKALRCASMCHVPSKWIYTDACESADNLIVCVLNGCRPCIVVIDDREKHAWQVVFSTMVLTKRSASKRTGWCSFPVLSLIFSDGEFGWGGTSVKW